MTEQNATGVSPSKTLRRLLSWLWKHPWMLAGALALTLLANLSALYVPRFAGNAIDAIGTGGNVDFAAVVRCCLYMLACVLAGSAASWGSQVVLAALSSKVTYEMRRKLFDHLTALPVRFFDDHAAGDIVSRISYDIDTINTSLSSDLVEVAASLITVTGSLIMMIRISMRMCIIFVFTTPLILYITKHRAAVVRPLFHQRSRKLGELNGFVEEMLSGHRTIKAYGQEDEMTSRFDERNEDAVRTYYEADYQGSIVGPTVTFINNLSMALIAGFGGILYLHGAITIGNISAFILYSKRFSGPVSGMAEIMAEMQSSLSAARRVFALMDEPVEKADDPDAYVLDHAEGDVRFEDVHFSYDTGNEILHGVDIHAEPGRTIAIVGPTGAGKTTIISLLMRFYDPDSGSITVDGHDTMHCTRDSLRRQFSMVLQDTWLFHGTIFENLAYGRKDVTKKEVIAACRAVEIHDFIMSLPDGYDTVLTDEGVNLSKGQKQLLTIARAMLSDAGMLIMDEATSNVDSATELKVQKAMRRLCAGKTAFIIAHRLSTIEHADEILVLQDGQIIERGTHQALLAAGGVYASLFNAQWTS